MPTQLILVVLLTPAYVGGAIAEEKDRGTLEYLLATDLTNREVVLSKFLSRLANLTVFLLAGLPLISMIQFLGGVDPLLVQTGFAATGLTMLGLGGLSILTSVHFKKPRDAIAVTYLCVVAYLVVSFLLWQAQGRPPPVMRWALTTEEAKALELEKFDRRAPEVMRRAIWVGSNPPTVGGLVSAFNAGNIFEYLPAVRELGSEGKLEEGLPGLLRGYALFHLPVAVVCVAWAVLWMRRAALKQLFDRGARRTLQRARRKPPVGKRPMLWKEIHGEGALRLNWMGWMVVALLMLATIVPVVVILANHLANPFVPRQDWDSLPGQINLFVRIAGTVVGVLALLAVGVRAAGSYSGERERQTLDSLLTTPMDSTPMLLGKWLGSICSVRLAWLWLGLIWGIGLALGGLSLWALPLLIVTWGVFAAFMATLGLWFSVMSRSSLRATLWTLLTTAGVGLGHWLPWMCCLAVPSVGSMSYLAKVQGGLTPPAALFSAAFYTGEFSGPDGRDWIEMIGFSLFGIFAWAVATVLLWSGLTLRFRFVTLREEFTRPERGWVVRRPRALTLDPLELPRPMPVPEARPAAPPEPRPAAPPPASYPPTRIVGAKLIDETWEAPRPPRHDDERER